MYNIPIIIVKEGRRTKMIKGQDILLLFKLCEVEPEWRQIDLALDLKISQSEIAKSLARCRSVGLLMSDSKVSKGALFELLVHSSQFFFPPEIGASTRGIATAWGVKELFPEIVSSEIPVWPHPLGNKHGSSLKPIYDTVPEVCLRNPSLYRKLALFDAIRIGRAREKSLAIERLKKEIGVIR